MRASLTKTIDEEQESKGIGSVVCCQVDVV